MRKYLFVYTNGISIKNETVTTATDTNLEETISWFKDIHKDNQECVIINIIDITNNNYGNTL